MYITHKKGQIAVCEVQRRALDHDIIISIPTTEERYDLVMDDGKLHRVQVKYGDGGKSEGSIFVDFRRVCRNNGYSKNYTSEEIDLILAYLPKVDKVVFIPPELFHNKTGLTIRTSPTKNNQTKGITFLEDLKSI